MNRPTQIVLDYCRAFWTQGQEDSDMWEAYRTESASDIREFCRDSVLSFPEAYDQDWFAILCVNSTEALVDYAEIARVWTESWRQKCDAYLADGYVLCPDNHIRSRDHPLFTDPQRHWLTDIAMGNYTLRVLTH